MEEDEEAGEKIEEEAEADDSSSKVRAVSFSCSFVLFSNSCVNSSTGFWGFEEEEEEEEETEEEVEEEEEEEADEETDEEEEEEEEDEGDSRRAA
jgi:hypothetical protein